MQSKPRAPFVYLLGAGPGDPDLLTLRAYRVLTEHADCVVYDRLISADILSLIPTNATRIYAGKSCTHHRTQDEINSCLVAEAHKGQVVVRLKGGDPFVFGRGGEEMEYLRQANIPYEIIPGVNAADGAAAALGIPLTHRDMAGSVRFITGHQCQELNDRMQWQSLVDPDCTLVVFMGLVKLEKIVEKLLHHGLSPSTPAIAIENATMPNMRAKNAALVYLPQKISEEKFVSPTLIIIGKVTALSTLDRL